MKPILKAQDTFHKLEIYPDQSAESPRSWDNLGTMVCWHRRYNLGDEQPRQDPEDYCADLPARIELPLYLYDHSGITMSTGPFSCPWDSGQVGFIYVTLERIRKEYGWKRITKQRRAKIEGYLRSEVGTYDDFLRGNVYGFVLSKRGSCDCSPDDVKSGDCDHWEESDSCWGFFGNPNDSGIADQLPTEAADLVNQLS
jgi:hypothetical protein